MRERKKERDRPACCAAVLVERSTSTWTCYRAPELLGLQPPVSLTHSWRWWSGTSGNGGRRILNPGAVLGDGGIWWDAGVEGKVQEVGVVVI